MNAPQVIAKQTADPDGLDFAALRLEGLQSLQALSGAVWTDYNVHDPGVTILEQLCFGLTELAYRSDLPPEDFLAEADGHIEYERHALYRPEEILPSGCVTDIDYRKSILDALPEVDNVHFEWGGADEDATAHTDGHLAHGAFKLIVSAENWLSDAPAERAERERDLLQRVWRVLHAQRGLCERAERIDVARGVDAFLQGQIIIDEASDPAVVLADLHYRCAALIAARVDAQRYEDVLAGDASLEAVFRGPFTEYGFIADAAMQSDASSFSEGELMRAARSVEGVERVMDLRLVDGEGRPLLLSEYALDKGKVCSLRLPDAGSPRAASLRLRGASASGAATGEIAIDPLLDAAHAELLKLKFEFQSHRNSRQSKERLVQLPKGTRHDLAHYYSIQQHFPPVYALGRDSLPRHVPPERVAAAQQLKAYLYPFEQLMANYLQSLEEIGPLFSVDAVERSYAAQFIGNEQLPDIEALYTHDAKAVRATVPRILAEFDPVHERRGRVLDYLLAIYGEAIPEAALRRFGYAQGAAQDAWLNEVRLLLLKALPELGRSRGRAFDCGAEVFDTGNLSSVQKKVAVLLGVQAPFTARLLSEVAADAGLKFSAKAAKPWTDFDAQRVRRVGPVSARQIPEKPASLARELPVELFGYGAAISNYRILKRDDTKVLCITPDGGRSLWPVAQSTERRTLAEEAHGLQRAMWRLNQASEGLHFVEHILLRAHGAAPGERLPERFYASRLSVVLPGWTARFADPNFREFAMETVCRRLPAHVLPDFYWFDFTTMQHFEVLYRSWLDRLRRFEEEGRADAAALDKAAERLAAFLLRVYDTDAHVPHYWI